jgi:hypothetical protein
VPLGSTLVVIDRGDTFGALTLSENSLVVVAPAESVTFIVTVEVPATGGVPLITPVDESNFNPAGRVPLATVHDRVPVPPVARMVALYADPTVPSGNGDAVAIASGEFTGAIVSGSGLLTVPDAASVTFTVSTVVPAVVGVPEITPKGFNSSPAGKGFEPVFRVQ